MGWAAAACAATALLATPLLRFLDLANIVMLFLLTVLVVAVKLGRRPAVLASVLSVVLFDVFFVPPRFSLAVDDVQYLVTFAVMLATALIASHLTAGLDEKAKEAETRESRAQSLYRLARDLAGVLAVPQATELAVGFIREELGASARVLSLKEVEAAAGALRIADDVRVDWHLARTALASGKTVCSDDALASDCAPIYVPLTGSTSVRGVLAVHFMRDSDVRRRDDLALLEALASLIAVALERLHYAEVAQAAEVQMLAERLRSSVLSAVSHDVRTPLTAMVGLADALFLVKPPLPPQALETASALREQATRLAGSMENLLDMARLHAGDVTLRREWQPLEEVIGASIKLLGAALDSHRVRVELPTDLPLLEFDAVLLERVFCNLLENAAKYAPPDTAIVISARREGDSIVIGVTDRGPGFPPDRVDRVFDMFMRGEPESARPGVGLGLAICKAIVEAHGGTIRGENDPSGGARVVFTLPAGHPPVIEEEAE